MAIDEELLDRLLAEGLFNLAFAIFRDSWDIAAANLHTRAQGLEAELGGIDKKVDQLLDRIVDASTDSVVTAFEKRIRDLEHRKALIREKIAACGKPMGSFRETYRTAFDFLANPQELWHSPNIEDRRAVLKLVFAQKLPYHRNEGYRTAETTLPFKVLRDFRNRKSGMVEPRGVEPLTS